MKERRTFSSGVKWESEVGYSRVVRVEGRAYVTGTTATDENGEVAFEDDAYEQTVQALHNIAYALEQVGFGIENVVRTRMFVTDISRWQEFGRAHAEVFSDIRPATSMIEVSKLIDPRMLIEIEADAEA